MSHLFFVDDTLIFCDADVHKIVHFRTTLACFATTSRLKINLSKSKLILVGNVTNLEKLMAILDCRHATTSNEVFGFSFGCQMQREDNMESYY